MARLPSYICIKCGRGFTSARSGRRHIATVESGNGYIATEADYRFLVLTGRVAPPIPKLMRPKHVERKERDPFDIAQEEFMKGYYWRMGQHAYDENDNKSEMSDMRKILFMRIMKNFGKQ